MFPPQPPGSRRAHGHPPRPQVREEERPQEEGKGCHGEEGLVLQNY